MEWCDCWGTTLTELTELHLNLVCVQVCEHSCKGFYHLKQKSAGVNIHLCLVDSVFTVMTHSYIRKTTGLMTRARSDLLCPFGSLAPKFSMEWHLLGSPLSQAATILTPSDILILIQDLAKLLRLALNSLGILTWLNGMQTPGKRFTTESFSSPRGWWA